MINAFSNIGLYILPFSIIFIGACVYASTLTILGKIKKISAITLGLTGIIVITCIFLPFNWSLHNSGAEKDVSLFFFGLNIQGVNFIETFTKTLLNVGIEEKYIQNGITFFLAFLEETAKLTLLILCIRKSLRIPVMIAYIFIVGHVFREIFMIDHNEVLLWSATTGSVIGGIILWILLGITIKTESVASYIYSIALVAVGFAFAENIKYTIDLSQLGRSEEEIINNAFLRSIFGYLSHIFFSMVCVALYARGRFAFLRDIDGTGKLSLTQKVLGWRGYTKLKTIQGFWGGVFCASLIHGIYNIYISENVIIPSIILVLGFLVLEFFVLHDLRNNTKYGHLENYMQE